MSKSDLPKLDLKLAWKRTLRDRPNRVFITHPHLTRRIDQDIDAWLGQLATELAEGYNPRDCRICSVPKPGWMVRPGSVLDIRDEVVYNAILGHFFADIRKSLVATAGDPDIAHQLSGNTKSPKWVMGGFKAWNMFHDKSLDKIQDGATYVVFSDITGFYDNIDHNRLASDLNSLSLDANLIGLLRKCLGRWTQPRGRGIPQGYSASDILAKLYLRNLDIQLGNAGFTHLRYVDDIRVFCESSLEAKKAVSAIHGLLFPRSLSLQSAKTEILPLDKARSKIDKVAPRIRAIGKQLAKEIAIKVDIASQYLTLADLEKYFAKSPSKAPVEVLEKAFEDNFSKETGGEFEKTLFHFLLIRLRMAKSTIAKEYCLSLLTSRPEETEEVLQYFSGIEIDENDHETIIDFACSKELVFEYQRYLIVRWYYEMSDRPEKIVAVCRDWAFGADVDPWVRSYAVAIVGDQSDQADLEMLESQYTSVPLTLSKADIVAATVSLEKSRRNSFYGRIEADGPLIALAIKAAKQDS